MKSLSITSQIQERATEILRSSKERLPLGTLIDKVWYEMQSILPEGKNKRTVRSALWDLKNSELIEHFSDGSLKYKESFENKQIEQNTAPGKLTSDDNDDVADKKKKTKHNEFDEKILYEPFKVWLKEYSRICTKAVVFGGRRKLGKWENPDVIGVHRADGNALVKFPDKLICVEIKTESGSTAALTALGQAVSYCLFSNYVYLVLPKDFKEDNPTDKRVFLRVDLLCRQFGIGLIVFDLKKATGMTLKAIKDPSKQKPDYLNDFFNEKHRPRLLEPDQQMQEEFIKWLHDKEESKYDALK